MTVEEFIDELEVVNEKTKKSLREAFREELRAWLTVEIREWIFSSVEMLWEEEVARRRRETDWK